MSDSAIQHLMEQALRDYEAGTAQAAAKACHEVLTRDPEHVDALTLLGAIFTETGNFEQAVELFKNALVSGGATSGTLFNYGVALRGADRLLEASRAFKNAAEAAPERADCWYNLGEAYRRLGRKEDAVRALAQAVELAPDDLSYGLTLGNAYLDDALTEQAVQLFQKLSEENAPDINVQNGLGVALRQAGQVEESENVFQALVEQHPRDPATLNNYGLTLAAAKKYGDAEQTFRRALDQAPDYAAARANLADVYAATARFTDAVLSLEIARKIDPEDNNLTLKLGTMYQKEGRLDDARRLLEPLAGPNAQAANRSLANVLRDLGDFAGARSLIGPARADAAPETVHLTNLGLVALHEGVLSEAINLFRQALAREPESPDLHLNLAHALLLKGDMAAGWNAFEGRLKGQNYDDGLGHRWTGEILTGKSILVTGEQGAGDCFQFCRYLTPLAGKAKKVHLMVSPRLRTFLAGALEDCEAQSMDDPQTGYDFQVPLLSLPHVMEEPVLPREGAYLSADETRVQSWRPRLTGAGPKIGIAWQGNRAYETDYLRSIPTDLVSEFVSASPHSFVSLQRGGGEMLTEAPANLQDFTAEMDIEDGFVDTAALMMSLDLIITSDTSVAHLAGALGRPVWVLLNHAPDWRWQLGRLDSPWYPTMRLFRQTAQGDWNGVFAGVKEALTETF